MTLVCLGVSEQLDGELWEDVTWEIMADMDIPAITRLCGGNEGLATIVYYELRMMMQKAGTLKKSAQ